MPDEGRALEVDRWLRPGERERLERFADAVRQSPHNLVSRRDREALWERHIVECVVFARGLPAGPHLIDVGSGGGFPGLVIAVCRPDLEVTLVESIAKKAAFLDATARQLELSVRTIRGRAEELTDLHGTADLVTARAVAPLVRLVPMVAPLLAPGGLLLAMKGQRWAEELSEAESAHALSGLEVVGLPTRRTDDDERASWLPRVVTLRQTGARQPGRLAPT